MGGREEQSGEIGSPDVCACGHRIKRDHKRTMRGEFFCWLCPDSLRCVDPEHIGGGSDG
jgi:hypothetical protein